MKKTTSPFAPGGPRGARKLSRAREPIIFNYAIHSDFDHTESTREKNEPLKVVPVSVSKS